MLNTCSLTNFRPAFHHILLSLNIKALIREESAINSDGYVYFGEGYVGYQDTSECINIGDINGDFEINIIDVITLVNIILDGGDYTKYGDINYDGYFNILDVVKLVNIILEK